MLTASYLLKTTYTLCRRKKNHLKHKNTMNTETGPLLLFRLVLISIRGGGGPFPPFPHPNLKPPKPPLNNQILKVWSSQSE